MDARYILDLNPAWSEQNVNPTPPPDVVTFSQDVPEAVGEEEETQNRGDINNANEPRDAQATTRLFLSLLQPSPLPLSRMRTGSGVDTLNDRLKPWKNYLKKVIGPDVVVAKEVGISIDPITGLYIGKFAIRNWNRPNSDVHVAFKVIQNDPPIFNMTPSEGHIKAGETVEIFLVSLRPADKDGRQFRTICIDSGFLVLSFPIPFRVQLNNRRISAIWKAYGTHLLPLDAVERHLVSRIIPEDDTMTDGLNIIDKAMTGNYLFEKQPKFPAPNLGIPRISREIQTQIYDTWIPLDQITAEEISIQFKRQLKLLSLSLKILTMDLKVRSHQRRILWGTIVACGFAVAVAYFPTIFENLGFPFKGVLQEYLVPEVEPEPIVLSTWQKFLPWNWL